MISLRWFLLATIALAPLLLTAKRPVHNNFEGMCSRCHLSLSDGRKIFIREIDFLCKDCHGELGLSHPSGMKPFMPIPDGFPLDWTGRITCATCHDVHGSSEPLLRGEQRGKVFCYACHKGNMGGHDGSGQHAHSRSDSGGKAFEILDQGNPIDRLSMECLSCHDSSLGRSANIRIGSGIWDHGNGSSHPIGVEYAKAYRRGGLRPPSSINPSIRFFEGRIGCGSCHNIYSKERFYLAINNRGSALCVACHKK
jgi:predicted CXXCH cytochrome family protein